MLFEDHLSRFLGERRKWQLGGARGIDQWATEWLLEHNEIYCIVVPFTAMDQPRDVQPFFKRVKEVIELRLPQARAAYIVRNRYMVDRSTIVIGFWSGKKGGTFSTLEYALQTQREVHAIPVPKGPLT